MLQEPLFHSPAEVLHFGCSREKDGSWSLRVTMRREGQRWDDAYRADYERLSSAELADVIALEALGAVSAG